MFPSVQIGKLFLWSPPIMRTRLQAKHPRKPVTRRSRPEASIIRLLMKKCLDLYAMVENYECKPRTRIPPAVRHGVWVRTCGRLYERLCPCCNLNTINVFNFHCAHIDARSKGGDNNVKNLLAICAECNLSMGTTNLKTFHTHLRGG